MTEKKKLENLNEEEQKLYDLILAGRGFSQKGIIKLLETIDALRGK